jgi:RNA polymerase sigma factor (TIGR02999 family)
MRGEKGMQHAEQEAGRITSADPTITELLQALQRGEPGALDALFPLVYGELVTLAHRQRLSWHGDLTLNTTAIVHEVYLKLVDRERVPAENRAHFFAVAAKAMRHILANYARDRHRQKRGGGAQHLSRDHEPQIAALILSDEQTELVSTLEEALQRLELVAERQSKIVECRFFGGMDVEDTATALGVSPRTVKRDWNFARAWLRREMARIDQGDRDG